MTCQGCGVAIDPSTEETNRCIEAVLDKSIQDAVKTGGVCPLCGHSKYKRLSHRKSTQFALLVASLFALLGIGWFFYSSRRTERALVVEEAMHRLDQSEEVTQFLGKPIHATGAVEGYVRQDETGWKEVRLTIPIYGPKGKATVHIFGGKGSGPWVFTTFEVNFETQRQKVDLISGRAVTDVTNSYVETHTEPALDVEYTNTSVASPTLSGHFPCVAAAKIDTKPVVQLGECDLPVKPSGIVDRFEADLRYGNFVMRQTDLYLNDVFEVPLTRTYNSGDFLHPNPIHAFGKNANHPYDIAPLGSRNPYTYQFIELEDGDYLYFDRISRGTGYADAVYQHTETATRFYRATQRWNGHGWTTHLTDGSAILFPESYSARNMAQGAPIEMRDPQGNKLELIRNGQRDLQKIQTPHGAFIAFTYDAESRINRAQDFQGNWVQYRYNSDGMLADAMFSSGETRHYTYDGVKMTAIQGGSGKILLRNWYSGGLLVRQQFENGETYSYEYHMVPEAHYAKSVVVTLPIGTQQVVYTEDSVPDAYKHPRN